MDDTANFTGMAATSECFNLVFMPGPDLTLLVVVVAGFKVGVDDVEDLVSDFIGFKEDAVSGLDSVLMDGDMEDFKTVVGGV